MRQFVSRNLKDSSKSLSFLLKKKEYKDSSEREAGPDYVKSQPGKDAEKGGDRVPPFAS